MGEERTAAPFASGQARLSRILPIYAVVATPAIALAIVAIGLAGGWPLSLAVIVGVAIPAVLMVRFRGVSIVERSVLPARYVWMRLRRRQIFQAGAFDIASPTGGAYGARWDGTHIVTVLRIDSRPRSLTLLAPGTNITDAVVPLNVVSDCLRQFDIALESIDVVSNGFRARGDNPIARIYERILGPLPATASRTVWVVLRLDPLASSTAVVRRGGDSSGSLRTAVVATRRVANRLSEIGHRVSVLSAREITSAALQLTDGAAIHTVDEHWKYASSGQLRFTSYSVDSSILHPEGLADLWSVPSLSTTLAIRLRRVEGDDGVGVSTIVRYNTSWAVDAPPRPGLRLLAGRQYDALIASLPLGGDSARPVSNEYRGSRATLDSLAIPASGCGQLIGADDSGRAVAMPLVGSQIRTVEIAGTLHLAQQVIFRAIALGAGVLVHSRRPEAWRPMVDALGDGSALAFAEWNEGHRQAGSRSTATVLIFDGIPVTPHPAEVTVIRLLPPGTDVSSVDADVTLRQEPTRTDIVVIGTDNGEVRTRIVATRDELDYIGASVGAAELAV